jgi:hypothetical protein
MHGTAQIARETTIAPPRARFLALTGVIVEVALVVLGVALTWWLTINYWHTGDFDVFEYQQYARDFWMGTPGQPRFTAFPTEYPPLALIPFSVTLLPGFDDPRVSFGLGFSALFLAGYAAVWRFVDRGAARRYAWFLLLALQSTLLARYDLAPALAVLAALLAARRRRFTLAYVLLAVGILLKLYPVVLLPLLMIEQFRAAGSDGAIQTAGTLDSPDGPQAASAVRRSFMVAIPWRRARSALGGAALCVGLTAAGFALPLLRNPAGALSFAHYATDRPIQVESFAATLLWLGSFVGVPLTHYYDFGSDAYASPFAGGVNLDLTLAMVGGCLTVYALHLRGRLGIERAAVVCVGLLLLGSKVFSTQYMTWLLPLAALAGGDTLATLLWGAVCLLTLADYPGLYPFNQPGYTATDVLLFMVNMTARNVLLLVATGLALFGFGRGSSRKSVASESA